MPIAFFSESFQPMPEWSRPECPTPTTGRRWGSRWATSSKSPRCRWTVSGRANWAARSATSPSPTSSSSTASPVSKTTTANRSVERLVRFPGLRHLIDFLSFNFVSGKPEAFEFWSGNNEKWVNRFFCFKQKLKDDQCQIFVPTTCGESWNKGKERAKLGFLKTLTFRRCCRNWTVIREREELSWKPKLVLFYFPSMSEDDLKSTSLRKKNPNFLRTVFSTLPLYEKNLCFILCLLIIIKIMETWWWKNVYKWYKSKWPFSK